MLQHLLILTLEYRGIKISTLTGSLQKEKTTYKQKPDFLPLRLKAFYLISPG